MTDTSTLPQTPPTTLPAAPTPTQPSLSDSLATALSAAPELSHSAGTAVAVASSGGDPVLRAQAVARGNNAASISDAAKAVAGPTGGQGEIAKIFGWLGHTASTAASDVAQAPGQVANSLATGLQQVGNTLNKPLSIVQHEYRYLHDVEALHGPQAAMLEGMGLLAGAGLGALGGGVSGAILGADAAGAIEGQFFYKDSWARTANGATYKDPHTGQSVSIGRDIADHIAGAPHGLGYNLVSGVIDGLFDLGADPLAESGVLYGKAHTLTGAPGKLGDLFGGLGVHAGDVAGEDVDRAYRQYRGVRNQFAQLASLDTGQIAARYPAFSPIAARLGAASTPEEVKDVFTDVFRTGELVTTDRLPTLSFTREKLQDLGVAAGNAPIFNPSRANIPGRILNATLSPAQWSRRLTRLSEVVDPQAIDISSREIDPTNDFGANAIYRLLYQGESQHVAANVAQEFLETDNIGRRMMIYRNGVINALAARANMDPAQFGVLADADTRSAFKEAIDSLTRGALPGVSGHYGNAVGGRDLSQVVMDDGGEHSAAILPNQTGKLRIPSAREFRNAAKVLQGSKDTFGRVDDFAFRHVTQNFFKRMVLLTLSYAEHISGAEIIPNGLRVGFTNLVRAGIEINRGAAARLSDEAETNVGAIRTLTYKLLRMDRGVQASPDDVKLAAEYIDRLGGHLSSPMVEAGHNISNEVKEVDRTAHLFRGVYFNAPKYLKYAKSFGEYGRQDEHFVDGWQRVLHEMSLNNDNEVIRKGAEAYLTGAREGLSEDAASTRAVNVMKNWLDAQTPRWRSIYERSSVHSSLDVEPGMSHTEDWARVMLEHLKGSTFSPEDGFNADSVKLMSHIANGEVVPTEELDHIPTTHRPLSIKGRDMVPSAHDWMGRVADAGFSKLLNPMVNVLSREPLAFEEFKRQFKMLEPATRAYPDLSEPEVAGMRHLAAESYNDLVKTSDELQSRIARNAGNRKTPELMRAYGLRQGVMDRLTREIGQRGETTGLTYEQVDELKKFADQIGHGLFDDVRIKSLSRSYGGMTTGNYEFERGLVNIFKGGLENPQGVNRTLIHELWHHLSNYAPKEDLEGLQRELASARTKFLKDHPIKTWYDANKSGLSSTEQKYFDKLIENGNHTDSTKLNWTFLSESPRTFKYLGNEGYRLTNLDEWFAESMYDRTATRLAATNPLVEVGHRFLSALTAAVGRVFGRATGERLFRNFWLQKYEDQEAAGKSITTRLTGRRLTTAGSTSIDEPKIPIMTRDEAIAKALARSSTTSIRFVHNLHDRTLWTDAMRNLSPFYFAQEQAYRRMGRLLATNPGAFRRYQMMITSLTDFAMTQNSSSGSRYAVIPGTGFLTAGVIDGLAKLHVNVESAVPVGMGWNVTSANVIFPLSDGARPGIGPVVAIPMEAMSDLFPGNGAAKGDVSAITSGIVGPIGASEPIWEQLVPNATAQRALDAVLAYASKGSVTTASWNSSVISTMQALDYHGLIPAENAGPIAQQQFINRVQNQATILTVVKAILGFVTPVSPEIQPQDYGFPAELTADIAKAGSVAAGVQTFLAKNPDATPWTVFRSHSTVGATPASSVQAEGWINANYGFISAHPYAGIYFMPQLTDTKYDSTVYNEQIAQGLRTKYTNAEFLNQLYTIAGNNAYYQSLDTYEAQTKNLSGTALSDAYNNFANWQTQFAAQHPIWAANYNQNQTGINRTQAINEMQSIIADNQVPKGSESLASGMKVLIQAYETYTNQVNLGIQDQYTHAENQRIKDNYQNYMMATAASDPELASVINSVFLYAPK